jgi:DNA helicase-2/ATP-dependent DNA helicase PcrA
MVSLLNPQQQAAALHFQGPAMVLAGAGSGKTRVLTTRVALLIQEHQVHPSQILLVTFTNKAAQEMNQRVMDLTGSKLPFSGTFHKICSTILRRDGFYVGLQPGFSIYDSDDQLTLIKQIYKTYGYSVKEYNPNAIKATISHAKNEMLTPEQYEQFAQGAYQDFTARIYKLYQAALKEQQAVDFDDLLLKVVQLFQSNKQILAKYQDQIEYVLVDEYQDTNKVQYELTKFFARPQNNLFVVGDFAQSIYAWRGADYRNMLQLKSDFPDMVEYRLEQNYRSTQSILDAATNVISKTSDYPVLELWTENTTVEKIVTMETSTGEDEANQVIENIQRHRDEHTYHDVAILYRTNAQSRPFEEALVRHGIPYRLVGGFKFYERKEIKDLLAYLRLVTNPHDTVSRERATKLGKRRLAEFQTWAIDAKPDLPPLELLQQILKVTKYLEMFDKNDPEDFARIENIQELLNVASQFTEGKVLLENVALVQDDYMADAPGKEPTNAVTLMSLHSAKGLEFPVVYMVGLEDGLLPHSRSIMDRAQMEEERRLCYVGITRAKEKLFFSYARMRWVFGTPTYGLRSRFLQDIPAELLEEQSTVETKPNPYARFPGRSSSFPPAPPKNTGRRLVIDDDMLDGVLTGDIDIKKFLED